MEDIVYVYRQANLPDVVLATAELDASPILPGVKLPLVQVFRRRK